MAKEIPHLTNRGFAQLLKVSPATVTSWMGAGMPHSRGGRQGRRVEVDLAAALPWVLQQRGAVPAGSQRDRLAKEQADKVALANAVERGNHMLRSQVEPVLMELSADLSARLDSIAGRLAGELAHLSDPAEIRHRLLVEHRSVRSGLADHLRGLSRGAAPE